MERRTSLYEYVLADLRTRLVSEQIAPGSQLPSIRQLQEFYQAGRSTIRNVLCTLQKEGCITLRDRRTAVAVPRSHDAQWRAAAEEAILLDRHNILSNYFTMIRIVPRILCAATSCCTARALPEYRAAYSSPDSCTAILALIDALFSCLGPGVQRLLTPFMQHAALAYIWDTNADAREAGRNLVRELGCASPNETGISQTLNTLCTCMRSLVRELVGHSPVLPRPLAPENTLILFPEIEANYMRILLDLLIRIGAGSWSRVGILPSENRLAAHYGVSVSTVREALSRLGEAGFTQTINGRGTLVVDRACDPMPSRLPAWLEQIMLCALYACQLIVLVMPGCALEAAQRTTPEDIKALESTFKHATSQPMRSLFHFMVRRQRLRPMRLILQSVGPLCDWGFALAVSHDRADCRSALKERAGTLLDCLRRGDDHTFATSMTAIYGNHLRTSRDRLILKYNSPTARAILIP